MCSTPKPKRSSQGKALASSTSILGAMNNTQRQAFAERANEASERRFLQKMANKQRKQEAYSSTGHNRSKRRQAELKKTWLYWLLSASLADVMQKLTSH